MSLLTYDEVRPWAKSIAKNVKDGTHAALARRSVVRPLRQRPPARAANEIDTLVRWVQSGAPEGDPADRPAAPVFADDEWILGEPDLVVTLEEVSVPAGKSDLFPKLIGRVMLPEDRWIQAVEFRAGNRKVLHHIIAFQVKGFERARPRRAAGWAPGQPAPTRWCSRPAPAACCRRAPTSSADMHYHPTDTDEKDTTRIGIHFVDGTR